MDANDEAGQDPAEQETSGASEDTDALISRLGVIEGQPLAERAAAFSQIYDEPAVDPRWWNGTPTQRDAEDGSHEPVGLRPGTARHRPVEDARRAAHRRRRGHRRRSPGRQGVVSGARGPDTRGDRVRPLRQPRRAQTAGRAGRVPGARWRELSPWMLARPPADSARCSSSAARGTSSPWTSATGSCRPWWPGTRVLSVVEGFNARAMTARLPRGGGRHDGTARTRGRRPVVHLPAHRAARAGRHGRHAAPTSSC